MGTQPSSTFQVFEEGGYASFRSGWGEPWDSAVVAHLRSARHSAIHYDPDDTTFEIYGFGSELVVDSGFHNYDKTDPIYGYQKSMGAHNVLTIEGIQAVSNASATLDAHGSLENVEWVHASHDHFVGAGFGPVRRAFAFDRARVFLVVDSIQGQGMQRFIENVHLHPSFDIVQQVDGVVIASSSTAGMPAISIAPLAPAASIEVGSGVADADEYRGWYFPNFNVAESANQIAIGFDADANPLATLGYLMVVTSPGESPLAPRDVELALTNDGYYDVSWVSDAGQAEAFRVPRP